MFSRIDAFTYSWKGFFLVFAREMGVMKNRLPRRETAHVDALAILSAESRSRCCAA